MIKNSKNILLLATTLFLLVGCNLFQDTTPIPTPQPGVDPVIQSTDTASPPLPTSTESSASLATSTIPEPSALLLTATIIGETVATSAPETPTSLPLSIVEGPTISHLDAGQSVILSEIQMLDPEHGWAIGGDKGVQSNVLSTSDGGALWLDVTPPERAPEDGSKKIALGFFLDANTAWVTYYYEDFFQIPSPPIIWHTSDGGQSWQLISTITIEGIYDIYLPSHFLFSTPFDGWLLIHAGAGMSKDYIALYHTIDGGRTWSLAIDPYAGDTPQSCSKNGLAFSGAQVGWMTRDCMGVIDGANYFSTNDGGETWEYHELTPPADQPNLFDYPNMCKTHSPKLHSAQRGILGVECVRFENETTDAFPFLYITTDGGASWQTNTSPSGVLEFINPDVGWALGNDIYKTTNGGQTWVKIKTVNWEGQFVFINESIGWAIARSGDEIAPVYTSDGGQTWELVEPSIAP
jgi:photosystem II stability/assembly factor-like uncharacterized protein